MSKAKRGGKISAYGSHQAQTGSSSRQVEVSPTITNMLDELQQLVKKTQVRASVRERERDVN